VTTKADAPPDSLGKMREFIERRRQGVGHFMDRSQLEKWTSRRTSEMLETVGGLKVQSGGSKGWVMNGRVSASSCTFCRPASITDIIDPADFAAGARPACYMDVYVDASLAFQFGLTPPMPLFDVNSIAPEAIEGIEVYSSAAQLPAKYNRSMGSGCGALLIWTRISPDKKP
jgi:hypothetical protein